MGLSVFGAADPDKLDELVGVADAIYAERGAAGGESLFGDEEPPADVEEPVAPAELELAPLPLRLKASAVDVSLYVLGGLWLAAILGRFASFHPAAFFASPDLVVTEQWQGGWTTKGVGIFVMAEAFITLVFGWQAYLGATRGQSIGKRIFGVKVVRADGSAPGFLRGVLLRSWAFGLVPLAVAAGSARPFSAHAFFANIPAPLTIGVALAVVALRAASFASNKERRGVQDLVAGTKVVLTEPWRLPAVQLGVERGLDPLMFKRISQVGMLLVAFVLANVVARVFDVGFWIY
jgi:uncharacterized RDD family membrane protein YckC